MLGVVLPPWLLAAGVGALIFVGLQNWTGFGAFSIALPDLPPAGAPDVAQFGWASVIGLIAPVIAPVIAPGIRRLALALRPHVERRLVLLTPLVGAAIAALAIGYSQVTGKGRCCSSPARGLPTACPWPRSAAAWSSPAMFIGAAGGIALSPAPGLPLVAGAAMGIGAMCVAMLRLPLTSVLLATLLMFSDGLVVMPVV